MVEIELCRKKSPGEEASANDYTVALAISFLVAVAETRRNAGRFPRQGV
jgi:hypothetical protein